MPRDLITQIKPSYAKGELSPSISGRVDFAGWHIGASVMRNMFVNYRGPASSRAGTLYCATSLTPASASSLPPRLINFQFNIFQSYVLEFGVSAANAPYMRVAVNGGSVLETAITPSAVSQANPCVITAPNNYSNGDWVFIQNVNGMAQLNGRTFVVQAVSASQFSLFDLFGNPINSLGYTAFSGGGNVARIYTTYSSPYALADLPYLKVVQSADVMTLCCVNQQTGTEYPPIDLARLAANNWTFTTTTFASAIAAPTGCAASTSVTGSPATQYAYGVTAVSAATGEESVISNIAYITNSDDIAVVAGSHLIEWNPVAGAGYYNVYQAPIAYNQPVPIGAVFAYIGTSYGTQFVNSNIIADQTVTPPQHNNPFARGAIASVGTITSVGTYNQATTTATITTASGTGGSIVPVIVSNAVVAAIVQNGGQNYYLTDIVTFADSSSGNSFSAHLNIGPFTGTYPSVPAYFQSRRVYAATLNNPDTLFFSQTGAYQNMDTATPPVDSDAIVTTPWGQQVNGIQGMQPMPGGLIVTTGLDAWQVSGAGGAGSTLTPASQSAQQQESNGFSPTVPPLKINYDILYNQALGYTIRDLQYNFFTNVYAGNDVSVLSNHLFDNFQIVTWAWANIPWKVVWATRNDGKFLSFTFDKEEQLAGWARHDTNGFVVGNITATEPPVNAPYFLVKRFVKGQNQWAYFIERMDNRLWRGPEDPWCVDAGLALPQPQPAATLSAAAAAGPGTITGGYLATGGQGYSNPAGQIVDPLKLGSGGLITFTQTGGVITGFTVVQQGQDYSPGTMVIIVDPTGGGASFVPLVSQNVIFTASAAIFSAGNVGGVIRIGGGQAVISSVINPNEVLAAIRVPILQTIPNDPYRLPVPAAPGSWTLTTQISAVTNLYHLEGMQVTGLADGAVIPLTTVVNGSIALPNPASAVTVGLPYIVQLQAMPIEIPAMGSIQGKRVRVHGMNVRVQQSRGYQIGSDQPIASALDFQQEIPWSNLVDVPDVPLANLPDAALPLFTGDKFAPINGDWQSWDGFTAAGGQVCAQQTLPLPLNVLAFVPQISVGD